METKKIEETGDKLRKLFVEEPNEVKEKIFGEINKMIKSLERL